jgi:hypothetical protein
MAGVKRRTNHQWRALSTPNSRIPTGIFNNICEAYSEPHFVDGFPLIQELALISLDATLQND